MADRVVIEAEGARMTIERVDGRWYSEGGHRIAPLEAQLQAGWSVVPPERVQLSRRKGWRLPPNTVVVSRPGRWGNPFVVGTPENGGNITRQMAVEQYERALREGRLVRKMADLSELAGKNLACWCPLDQPCHADVLLRLARSASDPKETLMERCGKPIDSAVGCDCSCGRPAGHPGDHKDLESKHAWVADPKDEQ